MRVFETLWFHRFCHREHISRQALLALVAEMERGRINADLGGGVYKERLARPHEGKSGGFRLLLCYHPGRAAFFTYGFPKSEKENITEVEKEDLRKLARILLGLDDEALAARVAAGAFLEISDKP